MNFSLLYTLLSLALALMAMATELPDNLTSAPATVTVTETVCTSGYIGDATPLSVANALASAANASVAASLIINMNHDSVLGYGAVPQPAVNTTTVRTVADATNCPAPPTFDPTLFSSILHGELNGTSRHDTNVTGIETSDQRWSQGRNSLCFTTSLSVGAGCYGIYLDGWGRGTGQCGKGILDNLRGQCGNVEHWGCTFVETSSVVLTFCVSAAYRNKCVLDAMWLASPHDKRETGLCCLYVGVSDFPYNTC